MPEIRLPKLHPGQIAVRQQARRFNHLAAGRRWRKTTLCMSISVEAALLGQEIIWGAPTYAQARIGFEEVWRAAGGVAQFNQSRLEVAFPDAGYGPGRIMFRSLDNPDNTRGLTASGLVIDEIASTNPKAFFEVLRPMLIENPNSWFWGIGTPAGVHNWWYREFIRAGEESDSMTWQAPTLGCQITPHGTLERVAHPLENPNIMFEEIVKLFHTQERHVFLAEILADFAAVPGGRVYDVWRDGYPEDDSGNVTELAEYVPGGGMVIWGVDDGYSGRVDQDTGYFTASSHPRCFGLYQYRSDGRLCQFAENAAVQKLSDEHIEEVKRMGYPLPEIAIVDGAAAELKARLWEHGIYVVGGVRNVDESIKEHRRWLAEDQNRVRRLLIHPRCKHTRHNYAYYRRDPNTQKPVKEHDHFCDLGRYVTWHFRHDTMSEPEPEPQPEPEPVKNPGFPRSDWWNWPYEN